MLCRRVKEFLSLQNVEFVDPDIAADETALSELDHLGYRATPVTLIDGEAVVGFERARLEKLREALEDS